MKSNKLNDIYLYLCFEEEEKKCRENYPYYALTEWCLPFRFMIVRRQNKRKKLKRSSRQRIIEITERIDEYKTFHYVWWLRIFNVFNCLFRLQYLFFVFFFVFCFLIIFCVPSNFYALCALKLNLFLEWAHSIYNSSM